MKPIARITYCNLAIGTFTVGRAGITYHNAVIAAFTITRKWAIPEGWEDNPEMWWHRADWLDATNPAEPGGTAYVDIYPGGWSFMEKAIRRHKQLGWRVVYRQLAGYVPVDPVLDRTLFTV